MTDLEQAARAESERHWPHEVVFVAGASWLAEHLLSDESVERALASWFESATHAGAYEPVAEHVKDRNRPRMRAALTAALGTNHNEQE